jgi:CheY-like chemotaxis protein
MPILDGYEACKQIREHYSKLSESTKEFDDWWIKELVKAYKIYVQMNSDRDEYSRAKLKKLMIKLY